MVMRDNISAVDGTRKGPHRLTRADWPFGSAARRGLLETVLLHGAPADGWTTRQLERQSGVARGGLRHALTGAQDWGLLTRDGAGHWRVPAQESDLAAPLRAVLTAIGSSHHETSSETIVRPRRRTRRDAILRRLARSPAHVTELCAVTGASRATVYRELRALRDAGAITLRRGVAERAGAG
jgi:DNA-binding transcriptional ArsR family regulator